MSQPSGPETGVPTCYRHPGRETYISCQRCGRPICPDCMRDASVGFHCPSCVAEGAKSTRAHRTAYGGQLSGNPALTSMALIGVNVAVWVAVLATGGRTSRLVDLLALRPKGLCVVGNRGLDIPESTCAVPATWLPGVSDGAWWQLLTNAFTHVEITHIAFNMIALWFLGPQLELVVGRTRFLALYLGSALTASALVYWASPEFTPTLGASGAIFGLMAGLLVVALKVRGNMTGILTWVAINFAFTFMVANVSWQGHLGGFLGGAAMGVVLVYAPRERRTLFQAAGLSVILVATLVAIAARTLVLS
jgi:membrane associated rhomboid family serine protease